jgi:predicted NAD/FAD-binding protein
MYSLNPRLYRMIFDVLRFNLFALDILKEEETDDMSIGEYLDREGYGDGFKEDYLLVCPLILNKLNADDSQ